jgi:hypothetical protein
MRRHGIAKEAQPWPTARRPISRRRCRS